MPHVYSPNYHTPDQLAIELESLGPDVVITGSVGRSALLGTLKAIKRKDGYALDIDAIPTENGAGITTFESGVYEVDTKLSRTFRPHEAAWGLFLDEADELPIFTVPTELCEPHSVALAWQPATVVRVFPLSVEVEMVGITSGTYFKNPAQTHQLQAVASSCDTQLPAQVARDFQLFRALRHQLHTYGPPENPYSLAERAYRLLRQGYLRRCPGPLQEVIEQNFGNAIRKFRGTDLSVVRFQ